MTHRLSMAAWLAEADGIPFEVQHLFDLSEYEAEAEGTLRAALEDTPND